LGEIWFIKRDQKFFSKKRLQIFKNIKRSTRI